MSRPLVNVIIPTHFGRDHFVHRLLNCLQAQTLKDFDVIIVDNDFNKREPPAFASAPWAFNINYLINPSDIGPFANTEKALACCRSRYIKPIMSDDLIAPEFLEKTVQALEENPDVGLAFTRRVFINEADEVIGETSFHQYRQRRSGRIPAAKLVRDAIKVMDWFPGEPSNFLLRNRVIRFRDLFRSPGAPAGLSYQGSFDLILYLRYLARGDAYFLNEPLALIRQHEARGLNESFIGSICHLDYFHFAADAKKLGLISEVDYSHAACKVFRYAWYKLLDMPETDPRKTIFLLKYVANILLRMRRSIRTKGNKFERYFLETALESAELIISRRITQTLLSDTVKLIGYGTGGFARKLFEIRHPVAERITAFVDSDPRKAGGTLFGRPVLHVDQLQKSPDQYILILSVFHKDITRILEKRGFLNIEEFHYLPFLG